MKNNSFNSIIKYSLILIIFLLQFSMHKASMQAHLPVGWYPNEENELHTKLLKLEQQAEEKYPTSLNNIRALIIPHAGYAYSGTVAASCFNLLKHETNKHIDRVIVCAPSHFVSFQGIAVPDHAQEYKIPTGTIKFDTKVMKKLAKQKPFIPSSKIDKNPFEKEHSFEIQCPFIHKYINNKTPIIPLLIGNIDKANIQKAADVLKTIITPNTLVIVSSDFTHYGSQFNYMPFGSTQESLLSIRALDFKVMEPIFYPSLPKFLQTIKNTQATICGRHPIALLLALLENKSLGQVSPHLVSYATSQDIDSTSPESSVSYAGIAFANDKSITSFEKQSLLKYAKDILLASFSDDVQEELLLPLVTPFMKKKCGTFITWKKPNNELRGCIGIIESTNSLIDNVRTYTKQAAFHDPRFSPISQEEAPFVKPSISILTPFQKIKSYKDIVIGTHGIVFKNGTHQAVFLPQVPIEQNWDLITTLEQLSIKSGLSKDAWKDKNSTFEVCTGYEIKQ